VSTHGGRRESQRAVSAFDKVMAEHSIVVWSDYI